MLTNPVKRDTIDSRKGKEDKIEKEIKAMMKDFTGRIIYTGHKFFGAWVINSNDTIHYSDKEEVAEGTWYYDRLGSGASIVWFVSK